MTAFLDVRTRVNLEKYLQDLICVVRSPEEVGMLVEALMSLQFGNGNCETARAKAARA